MPPVCPGVCQEYSCTRANFPSAPELNEALASLSVASLMFGDEVKAFAEERIKERIYGSLLVCEEELLAAAHIDENGKHHRQGVAALEEIDLNRRSESGDAKRRE